MGLSNYPNGFPFGLSLFGVPTRQTPTTYGKQWFVNTAARGNGTGGSTSQAFTTMARALAACGDNDVIFFKGVIREQLVAPLGVTGVSIIGAVGGNVRDDDGAKWTYPASGAVAGQALIEIREQGWGFYNFLMTPEATSGACIKAHRNEDATYPDSSHFVCSGMRFVGPGATSYGIQDVGGNHHYIINGCEFQTLTTAIYCSSTAIAVPLRNQITNNKFLANTNDISSSQSYGLIQGNSFFTPGAGGHTVVNVTANGAQGGINQVLLNQFNNTEAEIAPATGYTGAATDVWMNYVNNQAALAFGQPA